jgi:glycolate oxidase FAD binding subunit
MHTPMTLEEIQTLAREARRLLPVGAGTKSGLVRTADADLTRVDMRSYSGIVNYDPSEYLITVRAGTRVRDLALALMAQGQFLPFDPVWVQQGATIGGSIASGISGPGRLLYGGLRDFMLEVALVDSRGREIRGGGKVVKNAAGFDLPKLFVGSYGRLGILTEVTLKVFPMPPAWLTLYAPLGGYASAVAVAERLLRQPLPIAALEIDARGQLALRLAGPSDSLPTLASRALDCFPARQTVERLEPGADETQLWRARAEFDWAAEYPYFIRAAVTQQHGHAVHAALQRAQADLQWVFSSAASVAWIAARDAASVAWIDQMLGEQRLPGVVIRGDVPELQPLGDRQWLGLASRIATALDPDGKFPAYASGTGS